MNDKSGNWYWAVIADDGGVYADGEEVFYTDAARKARENLREYNERAEESETKLEE